MVSNRAASRLKKLARDRLYTRNVFISRPSCGGKCGDPARVVPAVPPLAISSHSSDKRYACFTVTGTQYCRVSQLIAAAMRMYSPTPAVDDFLDGLRTYDEKAPSFLYFPKQSQSRRLAETCVRWERTSQFALEHCIEFAFALHRRKSNQLRRLASKSDVMRRTLGV